MRRNRNIVILFLLLTAVTGRTHAQEADEGRTADSLRVAELYGGARVLFSGGKPYEALNVLGRALQLAMQRGLERSEADVLELIGDIYLDEQDPEEAIPCYLRVGSMTEYAGDSARLRDIHVKTGDAYAGAGVHAKAGEYYLKAEEYYLKAGEFPSENEQRMALTEKLGKAFLCSERPGKAVEYFLRFGELLETEGGDPEPAWMWLVHGYRETENFGQCLAYSEKLLERAEEAGDPAGMATLLNNMGYYCTELGRFVEALEYYTLAVDRALEAGLPPGRIAVMRANMGICYQNMNEPLEARDHLNDALVTLRKEGIAGEHSRIGNIQALIYYNENDLYNAGFFCREAISSAEEAGDAGLLGDACLTYSRVLRAGNDPVSALRYYEEYLAIRDSLQLEERLRQQELEQKIARLEQSENDLLMRVQQERVSELAINRLTLQLEREEQARELLERENELRLMEQERLRQEILITEQQHRVERQERQNRILEQEQRIARMALEEEQRKQREAAQEIQLLEQQQRLDQLSLDKQKQQRKGLIGIVVLMILVVILVTGSLLLTRKKNEEISAQRDEIEGQRDEIEAQRDELEAQRDMLFEQKEAIELYSTEVTKSIEYARRIQAAALPDMELLREIGSDYFVLFRPRDIVSGDFYWMARMGDSTVVVVADCTGHGVPGAFMSMMGMAMLKEIVQKEYITHPGVILRRMRKEIIKSLGQKGTTGEQRDGMDISLVEINHREKTLKFAGAYNPLYLVRDDSRRGPSVPGMKVLEGEGANGSVLYEIPADKMPVAFFDRMDKFTTHELEIMEGDRIYMFSDGYADQFGGERGKKFKYLPFKKLILAFAGLPMAEQSRLLGEHLDTWMGTYEQVDDICMMGLRFQGAAKVDDRPARYWE